MEKRRTSFLGSLIIIIIIVITIYLLTKQANTNYVTKIKNIDDKYLVNSAKLLPTNEQAYIVELKTLNNKQYTQPIIDFINLDLKAKKIHGLLELNKISNENCVSKELLLSLDSFLFYKQKTINEFDSQKDNSKLSKIYWNDYLDLLNSMNQLQNMKIELSKIKKC